MSRQDCKHCREASDLFPLDSCSPPIDRAARKLSGLVPGSSPGRPNGFLWLGFTSCEALDGITSVAQLSVPIGILITSGAVPQSTECQRAGNQIDAARTVGELGFDSRQVNRPTLFLMFESMFITIIAK